MPAVIPFIPLIAGGIGAAGAVAGGYLQSRGSGNAARTQAAAGQQVAQQATAAGEQAATDVTAAGEGAAAGVTDAAQRAAAGMWLSADDANALLRSIYGDVVNALEPYTTTGATAIGQLNAGIGPEGEFGRRFTAADLEMDPGYQFRLTEGTKALERSAAARGTLVGGRTLKELTNYSQGAASQEYAAAFDRAQRERAARFGMLYNLAGIGMDATQTGIQAGETYGGRAAGNILTAGKYEGDVGYNAASDAGRFRTGAASDAGGFRMRGAEIAGNATTGAANATAAGQIGSANAWTGALGQIANTGMDLAYLTSAPAYRRRNPNSVTTGIGHRDPSTGEWVNG